MIGETIREIVFVVHAQLQRCTERQWCLDEELLRHSDTRSHTAGNGILIHKYALELIQYHSTQQRYLVILIPEDFQFTRYSIDVVGMSRLRYVVSRLTSDSLVHPHGFVKFQDFFEPHAWMFLEKFIEYFELCHITHSLM